MNLDNKKQNFNGGYIKASQEAYDLLIETGYIDSVNGYEVHRQYKAMYLFIDNNCKINSFSSLNYFKHNDNLKQFYINNGELSWNEPDSLEKIVDDMMNMVEEAVKPKEKSNEQLGYNIDSLDDNVSTVTDGMISVEDEDGKVEWVKLIPPSWFGSRHNNRDFEFTYNGEEFDITLNTEDHTIPSQKWLNGLFNLEQYGFKVEYSLTPIQKKWYEDEAIFAKGVDIIYDDKRYVAYSINDKNILEDAGTDLICHIDEARLLTKQEYNNLYYKD